MGFQPMLTSAASGWYFHLISQARSMALFCISSLLSIELLPEPQAASWKLCMNKFIENLGITRMGWKPMSQTLFLM
jgi:hypothetical protein